MPTTTHIHDALCRHHDTCATTSLSSTLFALAVATATGATMSSVNVGEKRPREAESEKEMIRFAHAERSYFALDQLVSKGRRKNVDVGDPHDATRPFFKLDRASVGSWHCTEGGWDSPTPRPTTECFLVFAGEGSVSDPDGVRHPFKQGDLVVLPKGWHGRWDITKEIHKVWVVHDHAEVEGASTRAVITPPESFDASEMTSQGVRKDATHGAPSSATRKIYGVGTTAVGCWSCSPGSFPVVNRPTTECFHVLAGVFFLTNADGSARRCVAGDTVVLPKHWSGHWDIIEPVKKVWVVISD